MIIKDIGGQVASVWEGLRPVTRKMLVRALQSTGSQPNSQGPKFQYDAHADWEVSRLLTALDERSRSDEVKNDGSALTEISQLARTCVRVLETQTASAEVFIQLATRAIQANDYDHLDKLGDLLSQRFSASEIAEIIRQTELPQIRAIAYETLAMMHISSVVPLLEDPLYAGIAASSLEQRAFEFESEEARAILERFDAENERSE
jgi:hypothetical protein